MSRGRCELVSIHFAGRKLQIHLDSTFDEQLDDDTKQRFRALSESLKTESEKDTSPFELVSDPKAEFSLGVIPAKELRHSKNAWLKLRTQMKGNSSAPAAVFDFGDLDENSVKRIATNFQYMSRAKRLVNLALESSGNSSAGRIRTTLTAEIADQFDGSYVEVDLNQEAIPVGKFIRFRIRNYSPRVVKVTLLYIGDDFKILPLLPSAKDSVDEIPPMRNGTPGEKILDVGAQLTIESRLRESIVAIITAKEAGVSNSDYTYLKQDPLAAMWMENSQSRKPRSWNDSERGRGNDSPLKYLVEIGFNPSQSRNMSIGNIPDHAFNVLTFISVNPFAEKQP